MNDYPYNRIILDIVELSQELRQQGKPSLIGIHSSGSLSVDLFDSVANKDAWLINKCKPLISEWVHEGDCEAALNVWNQMMMHVDREDDLWAVLDKRAGELQ